MGIGTDGYMCSIQPLDTSLPFTVEKLPRRQQFHHRDTNLFGVALGTGTRQWRRNQQSGSSKYW